MASEQSYRHWYAKLLRLYPKPYRERFGEGMEQTFSDLLRDRREAKRGLFAFALWLFIETSTAITRENILVMNKNTLRIALVTALLLLVPLLAMQFTDEVAWNLFDFVVAGVLLFGTGVAYELVARRGNIAYRAAVGLALAAGLFLIWANLAVGLIGSEDELANLMYFGVVAVGIIGAIIARFRAPGMARALFATALAQGLVAVIALIAGMDQYVGSSVSEILAVNAFFVVLFVVSASLFQRASAANPT